MTRVLCRIGLKFFLQYLNPNVEGFTRQVTSPYGNNLYHQENVTHGQFAFTTTESGNYMACFWLDSKHQEGGETTLSLDWRTGIAGRDWDSIARIEKIEVGCSLQNQVNSSEFLYYALEHLYNYKQNC